MGPERSVQPTSMETLGTLGEAGAEADHNLQVRARSD
jgi:hypothetical protein